MPVKKRNILVVEDNPDELQVTRESLEEAGFAVGAASNGIEALRKAHMVPPDLILLDVMMPGLNGFTVCQNLRENPITAAIPILVLTGLCSQISQISAFESGASDYLTKPFVPEELISRVEKLLDKAGRLVEQQKTKTHAVQTGFYSHKWLSQASPDGE